MLNQALSGLSKIRSEFFLYEDCKDAYPVACADWGKQGECNANPAWMGKNCPVTCGTCNGGEKGHAQSSFGEIDLLQFIFL